MNGLLREKCQNNERNKSLSEGVTVFRINIYRIMAKGPILHLKVGGDGYKVGLSFILLQICILLYIVGYTNRTKFTTKNLGLIRNLGF